MRAINASVVILLSPVIFAKPAMVRYLAKFFPYRPFFFSLAGFHTPRPKLDTQLNSFFP